MSPRTRLAMILGGGAALLVLAAIWFVMAGDSRNGTLWLRSERAVFMKNCVEQCRKAPGVTEDRYPLCDAACTCSADEGEKTMTAQELDSAAQATMNGNASAEQSAKMERLRAAGIRCVAATAPTRK